MQLELKCEQHMTKQINKKCCLIGLKLFYIWWLSSEVIFKEFCSGLFLV
jgi:hypothetical protein